jgi:hypothetical protein
MDNGRDNGWASRWVAAAVRNGTGSQSRRFLDGRMEEVMAHRREDHRRHSGRGGWPHDRGNWRGDWPDDAGRREDPDEFPGPARSPSPQQAGHDERFGRAGDVGYDVGYSGRYAGRTEGAFANYGGRPGGVTGGRYGAYHDLEGSSRYGGQYAGLSPGDGRPSWRGKGPKGYVRSDERIREDVCECLTDDPALDAGDIEVEVKEGEVTLSGSVSSRAARRHAEDLVDSISGVRHLQNNLRSRGHEGHEPALASRTAGTNGRPR